MANLRSYMDESFDDKAVEPSKGSAGAAIPEGDYQLQIEKSEIKHTKAGTGVLMRFTMVVLQGPREGALIFTNMNIRNPNVQAQTIGIAELKALCAAIGVSYDAVKEDDIRLLYKPFMAHIGFEKEQINDETGLPWPPRNRITRYIARDPKAPAVATPHAAPTQKPAQTKKFDPDDDVPF